MFGMWIKNCSYFYRNDGRIIENMAGQGKGNKNILGINKSYEWQENNIDKFWDWKAGRKQE